MLQEYFWISFSGAIGSLHSHRRIILDAHTGEAVMATAACCRQLPRPLERSAYACMHACFIT